MLPPIAIVGLLAGGGFGLWKLLSPPKPKFQVMTTKTSTGIPVKVATPVSDSVTVAQSTTTVPSGGASSSTAAQAAVATPVPTPIPNSNVVAVQTNSGTSYAPAGSMQVASTGQLQMAPIVITPTGVSSVSIASVTDVQNALNTLGYQPTLKADGALGPLTIANIKQFQGKVGLAVDGNAGPATKAALAAALAQLSGSGSAIGPTVTSQSPASGSVTAPSGASIDTTPALKMGNKDIQTLLNTLGASPTLTVDGNIGPMSVAAIKSFQTAHGLTVDGVAGPQTKTALFLAVATQSGSAPALLMAGDYAELSDEFYAVPELWKGMAPSQWNFGGQKKYPHAGFSPGEWWAIARHGQPFPGKLTPEQTKEYNAWKYSPTNPYGGYSPAEWWHTAYPTQQYPGKLTPEQFQEYLQFRYQDN